MSKIETEKEIIAKYVEGWSLTKIQAEYDLTAFDLAWILGKNNVSPRPTVIRHFGADVTIVTKQPALKLPIKIIRDLDLKSGQKIKFLILDKGQLTLQLEIIGKINVEE